MKRISAWLRLATLGVGALGLAAPRARGLGVEEIFREPHLEGTRAQSEVLSPDDRWVAFAWNPSGRNAPLDLYVVPVGGGKPRALTTFPRDTSEDSSRAQRERLRARAAAGRDSGIAKLPEYFRDEDLQHRVGGIAWSPDARRIAFVDRGDLYIATPGGGSSLERLTRTNAFESEPSWSPDGRWLAFLRDGAIWSLELGRSGEVQLTQAGGDSLTPSGIRWSPDGRHIAYLTQNDTGLRELLIPNYLGERVKTGRVKEGLPDQGVRVVRFDPVDASSHGAVYHESSFRTVSLRFGLGKHPNINAFAWSPDAKLLAVDEILPDMRTHRVHVARADSGSVRTVYSEVDSAWIEPFDWVISDRTTLDWSPDGRWILFLSERTGYNHLLRVSRDGGPAVQLTDGPWEVGWGRWLADGRRVLLLGNRAATSERHLELLDVASRALTPLATAKGMNTHVSLSKRGGVALYRHSRFAAPQELCTLALRAGARPTQVTSTVPDTFRNIAWSVPEIVTFPAKDGVTLHGLLYRPQPLQPGRRYPVVVFVHGAGSLQNVVDGWTFYAANYKFHTLLTQRGYAVFEVDYRGSLGYGRDFRTGVYMHMGGKDLDDELAGIDYLKRLDLVDASRIGIYGGSYGGFMALMALFRVPDVYACGAALRAVSDWANYYRGNPGYCMQRLGTPEKNAAAYYRSSPIHFAEGLQRPLLLLHGMRDDNVHFQDATQLTERLIRLGKKFDLMMYPRESHGFTAPASWTDEYRRIADFFDLHLATSSSSTSGE